MRKTEEKIWVLRFGRKEKLYLRFIRPYEILERIGPVAYRFALPSELDNSKCFSCSMLRRYPSHVLTLDEIELQPDLTYIKILTLEVKELRNKCVELVKVNFEDEIF
ncbi:Chromo domain-containing protein [Gossypium australe]|uniref:Chromo domain-containing protein n=1 Tax=Gossypium australe TaxID=47621 RepID=A0A5B6VQ67_9ROSI|nr:Chromo domain-containing protein [Gossypium australe]